MLSSEEIRLVREAFQMGAAPLLVREVALVLAPLGIRVMPLKAVLLQRIVYGRSTFRSLSDVDILVTPSRFDEARMALKQAGFTVEREEWGGWEVALRRPGALLEIDLHRRLSSTSRSYLRAEDVLARGTRDRTLFGADVLIQDSRDLFAHLVLHMALGWLSSGRLHRPQDLEEVPRALSLGVDVMADHLREMGLDGYAALTLPLVEEAIPTEFVPRLRERLIVRTRARVIADLGRYLCAHKRPRTLSRRALALALSPSWRAALRDAAIKRIAR